MPNYSNTPTANLPQKNSKTDLRFGFHYRHEERENPRYIERETPHKQDSQTDTFHPRPFRLKETSRLMIEKEEGVSK